MVKVLIKIVKLIYVFKTERKFKKLLSRPQMPGSIRGHACRPSRSEFSVVFYEIHLLSFTYISLNVLVFDQISKNHIMIDLHILRISESTLFK